MVKAKFRQPEVDHDDAIHRDAFNAAFRELGLNWRWGNETYRNLLNESAERERVRTYVETHQSHLLKAYDAEFLVNAILAAKAKWYEAMRAECAQGSRAPCAHVPDFEVAEVGF